MKAYDSMALYLYTACPTHKQGKDAGCNEWDFIQQVYICDQPVEGAGEPIAAECEADVDTVTCQCTTPAGATVDATFVCAE